MRAKRDDAQTPVRFPLELKNWLKHKAIDNGRSMNSEILVRLQESRRREEGDAGAKD
ncbi:Arc family DNA-binding protein [Cupriavidus basilensis]